MLAALFAYWQYGMSLEALAIAGLCWCVIAIFVTDLEHYIILDEVQIALALAAVLFHYAQGSDPLTVGLAGFSGLLMGLALKYGFLWIRKKDGLGLGDVKLLFGVGLWLASTASFIPFLFIAGLLGVVFGMVWRLLFRSEIFPFGPALALSLLGCVLWPELANGFWSLYGFLSTPAG